MMLSAKTKQSLLSERTNLKLCVQSEKQKISSIQNNIDAYEKRIKEINQDLGEVE